MIPTCPKCQSQYKERDNFCIECGKDLNNIKKQNKIKTMKIKNFQAFKYGN